MAQGPSKRYFEFEFKLKVSAVREMTERAAAESRQTGQEVSPGKHAKLMDAERVQDGKKNKGRAMATPMAAWVTNVLGPLRAQRNRSKKVRWIQGLSCCLDSEHGSSNAAEHLIQAFLLSPVAMVNFQLYKLLSTLPLYLCAALTCASAWFAFLLDTV